MIASIATLPPRSALVELLVSLSPSIIPGPDILQFSPSVVSSAHPSVIMPYFMDPSNPVRAVTHEIDAAILLILSSSLRASL